MNNDKNRIMVVDDQPINLKIVKEIIEDEFDYYLAASGQECLDNLTSFSPDLVLLDIMMPEVDGYEVCKKIKENDEWKDIQVIFLSAKSSIEDKMKGFDCGAADYFIKPFEPEELLLKINRIIEYENNLRAKEVDMQSANKVALNAMTNASEVGLVLRFMQESFLVKDYSILARMVLDSVAMFKLDCCLQVRVNSEIVTINNKGIGSPLEEQILKKAVQKGRIYDINEKSFFNYDVISLLIKNMPLEDKERYGEIKDLACFLLSAAQARIHSLLAEGELKKQTKKFHDAQEQLLQSEKMASIGQLAAGVAHEINNPVGYISSNISSLTNYVKDIFRVLESYEHYEKDLSAENAEKIKSIKNEVSLDFLKHDITELVSESMEGVDRVKNIVQDLKDFSHVDEAEWQWANLHKGLDSTLNIVNNELKYKADVIKEYGDIPDVECIISQLNQVFMNLLVNAAHAIEDFSTITISTGKVDEDKVCVKITDKGKGMDEETMRRIFDPFYTTKPVGQGTGLGLSLSYSIVQKHNGKINVESTIGEGTTFTIELPVHQPEAKAE